MYYSSFKPGCRIVLFCSHPIIFLEPLGGADALRAIVCSRSLSLNVAHPCNIMWDEGNCYGKLNEIKREKQLHSPLSCVISELSLWRSCPDGLRVWWSWQPAAPGPDGNPISGPSLFHGSLSACDSLYLSFFSHLFHSQCRDDGLSIIILTQSRQILALGSKVCVHGSLFSCAHAAPAPLLLCTLWDFQ